MNIFALSSGKGPSGIAIIRISGPQTLDICKLLTSEKNIKILDIKRNEFARGLSSFSSIEINKIIGCQSNEIQKILGYITKSEVVHKDDMVEV